MRKSFLFLLLLLCAGLPVRAQGQVDRLYFDMRASFHQDITDGRYNSQAVGEYLNFHLLGHITPKVEYRIRQRLNKKVFDEKNMFNATDFMYVKWQATERWSFLAGKSVVMIGGYEYDAAPIDVIFDVDLMNRSGFGQKQFLLSDFSLISKIIWSVGKWNICGKAGSERNDAANVDPQGRPYDLVIAPGTEYVYAGCGLEWFPLGRDNLRLHAVYYRDNAVRRDNIELGLTWRVDVINR